MVTLSPRGTNRETFRFHVKYPSQRLVGVDDHGDAFAFVIDAEATHLDPWGYYCACGEIDVLYDDAVQAIPNCPQLSYHLGETVMTPTA